MKILLLLFLLFATFNCQAGWFDDEEPEDLSIEYKIYLEETNFRITNVMLLDRILKELKAIRCQTEESVYCYEFNEENEDGL
jgi:hypothetical protein